MLMQIDWGILNFIHKVFSPYLDKAMPFIIKAGSDEMCIALLIMLLFFRATHKMGVQTVLAVGLQYVLGSMVIKNLVMRPRPFLQDPSIQLIIKHAPKSFSFPSGHAGISFAIAFSIFFSNCSRKWKIVAIVLATIVAFSRLYLRVHFPSDVFTGAVLGIFSAWMAKILVSKFYKKL